MEVGCFLSSRTSIPILAPGILHLIPFSFAVDGISPVLPSFLCTGSRGGQGVA